MSVDYYYEVVPDPPDLESGLRQLDDIMRRGQVEDRTYLELYFGRLQDLLAARRLLTPISERLEPVEWRSVGGSPKAAETADISEEFFDAAARNPIGFHSLYLYCHFRGTPATSKVHASLSYVHRGSSPSIGVLYGPGTLSDASARRRLLQEVFRELGLSTYWEPAWETLSIGTNQTPVPPIRNLTYPDLTIEPGGVDRHGSSDIHFVPRKPEAAVEMFNKLRSRLVDQVHSYVVTVDGTNEEVQRFGKNSMKAGQAALQAAFANQPVSNDLVKRLDGLTTAFSISWRVGPVSDIRGHTFGVALQKNTGGLLSMVGGRPLRQTNPGGYRFEIEFWMGPGAGEEMKEVVELMQQQLRLSLRFLEIN